MGRIFASAILIAACIPATRGDEPKPAPAKYPFAVKVSGDGTPMILIPGLACGGAVWDDTVQHFSKKYQCHVLTLAGFAGEPAREGAFLDPIRDGILQYIRDKKLDRPIIVGHSIGGFLAYELGIAGSDVVGPLVAVDGVPFLAALSNDKATEDQMKVTAEIIAKKFASMSREDYQKQIDSSLANWFTDKDKRSLASKWGSESDQATVGKAISEMYSRDLREKVAKIKAPVLVVAAPVAFGVVTKEEAEKRYRAQVEKIPNKTIAIAEKSKHFVMFDEPDWLWKTIEEFVVSNRK